MKGISTGFGLALLAGAILAYPFVSSLAPSANASAVTTAASAVSTAATGQAGPTIVWYQAVGDQSGASLFRAWSDGRIEVTAGSWKNVPVYDIPGVSYCRRWQSSTSAGSPFCDDSTWFLVSDPAQGLTYRSDINFDEKVDGADLGALLADWGDAPRQDIPPSDCPLALVNP
jgi:hypothetical protein